MNETGLARPAIELEVGHPVPQLRPVLVVSQVLTTLAWPRVLEFGSGRCGEEQGVRQKSPLCRRYVGEASEKPAACPVVELARCVGNMLYDRMTPSMSTS